MPSALFVQGVAAFKAGDLSTAERIFLAIVERDAAAHDAWHALSVVAVRAGLPDVAVERARRAVELDRRNAEYLNSLGIAHGEQGEFDLAAQAFRRALKNRPVYLDARYNLAKVLRKGGRLAESLREYERAYALEPRALATQLGLSATYRLLGRPEQALAVMRAAVGDAMPDADRIAPLGEYIADVEGPEAELAWLRGLLAREPDCHAARYLLGLLQLSLGRWSEGWAHYLWRPHGDPGRRATLPAVLPRRLDGRRVLLRGEQGIGDVLFYLRFAGELRERGAALELECPPPLAKLEPLLAGRITPGEAAAADLRVWIADLPALLESDATPPAFPLRAEDVRCARVAERLAQLGPPPYLGLTWRAGTDARRDREFGPDRGGIELLFKEIPPALLGQAVRGWPGTLVSLQRKPTPAELGTLRGAAGAEVHDLAAVNDDLREALALLAQLDEYVAVSNANIHLLAGLGRTARVLVPYPSEWRWMRGEGGSVWFAGFSVYRQPVKRDWSGALARLRGDLLTSCRGSAAA